MAIPSPTWEVKETQEVVWARETEQRTLNLGASILSFTEVVLSLDMQ